MIIRLNMKGRPVIDLEVSPDDNLYDLKDKIEAQVGVPVNEQIIHFNGEELERVAFRYLAPRSLTDFGIRENSLVDLSGGVKIFCKLPGARLHQTIVTVFSIEKVYKVKEAIREKDPENSPPIEDMVLTQDGEVLQDDKILNEYGIGVRWWFTCITVRTKKDFESKK